VILHAPDGDHKGVDPHVLIYVALSRGELEPGKDRGEFAVASRIPNPPFGGAFVRGVDDKLLARDVVGGGGLNALDI
jgi:hypothetical protein